MIPTLVGVVQHKPVPDRARNIKTLWLDPEVHHQGDEGATSGRQESQVVPIRTMRI